MGDGIGHVVTGVAVGLLTGASHLDRRRRGRGRGAVVIEVIRERGHTNGDVALALLFYGGLAGGGVLITGLPARAGPAPAVPFGSITTISVSDVVVTMVLAVVVVLVCVGLAPQLAVAQGPGSRAGSPVRTSGSQPARGRARGRERHGRHAHVGLLLVSALMVGAGSRPPSR